MGNEQTERPLCFYQPTHPTAYVLYRIWQSVKIRTGGNAKQLSYCTYSYSIIVPLVPCSMPNHGRCSLAFSITSLQVFLNHKTIKIQAINGIKYKYNVCNLLHQFIAGFPEPLTLIYVAPWVHIEHSFPELRKNFLKNLKTRKMLWCHRPLCYC